MEYMVQSCDQFYKTSTSINYNSRVIFTIKLLIFATLGALQDWQLDQFWKVQTNKRNSCLVISDDVVFYEAITA